MTPWTTAIILAVLGLGPPPNAPQEVAVPIVADRVEQVAPVDGTECLRIAVDWYGTTPHEAATLAAPESVRWSLVGQYLWFDWAPHETQDDAYEPDGSVQVPAGATEVGVCR